MKIIRSIKQTLKNRSIRKDMRKLDIMVYASKFKALRKGKKWTRQYKEVYWVNPEKLGYYVINVATIDKLNKNESKHKGHKKIRSRDLNKSCIWRSPNYSDIRN
ncbi:MAG: hypothetical protein PF495_13530 [Spirochaetales bacterium]|jgi:hypothetical protein|nr:hypothetical protein [Spirochaetales bacterium]